MDLIHLPACVPPPHNTRMACQDNGRMEAVDDNLAHGSALKIAAQTQFVQKPGFETGISHRRLRLPACLSLPGLTDFPPVSARQFSHKQAKGQFPILLPFPTGFRLTRAPLSWHRVSRSNRQNPTSNHQEPFTRSDGLQTCSIVPIPVDGSVTPGGVPLHRAGLRSDLDSCFFSRKDHQFRLVAGADTNVGLSSNISSAAFFPAAPAGRPESSVPPKSFHASRHSPI